MKYTTRLLSIAGGLGIVGTGVLAAMPLPPVPSTLPLHANSEALLLATPMFGADTRAAGRADAAPVNLMAAVPQVQDAGTGAGGSGAGGAGAGGSADGAGAGGDAASGGGAGSGGAGGAAGGAAGAGAGVTGVSLAAIAIPAVAAGIVGTVGAVNSIVNTPPKSP